MSFDRAKQRAITDFTEHAQRDLPDGSTAQQVIPVDEDSGNKLKINPDGSINAGIVDLLTRFFLRSLRQLSIDTAGRLRVAAESVANMSTLTTLTNITNWGALNAISRTQVDTHMAYQQGFRRNLVVT